MPDRRGEAPNGREMKGDGYQIVQSGVPDQLLETKERGYSVASSPGSVRQVLEDSTRRGRIPKESGHRSWNDKPPLDAKQVLGTHRELKRGVPPRSVANREATV